MISKFSPSALNANVFCINVWKKSHPIYDQAQGSSGVFS
jgi:ribosomal protein L31